MNHAKQIGIPLFVLMSLIMDDDGRSIYCDGLFWNKEDARKEMPKQYREVMKKVLEDHGKLPQGYTKIWDTGASICTDTCPADEYEWEISERRIMILKPKKGQFLEH